jgi:hypothetical protein
VFEVIREVKALLSPHKQDLSTVSSVSSPTTTLDLSKSSAPLSSTSLAVKPIPVRAPASSSPVNSMTTLSTTSPATLELTSNASSSSSLPQSSIIFEQLEPHLATTRRLVSDLTHFSLVAQYGGGADFAQSFLYILFVSIFDSLSLLRTPDHHHAATRLSLKPLLVSASSMKPAMRPSMSTTTEPFPLGSSPLSEVLSSEESTSLLSRRERLSSVRESRPERESELVSTLSSSSHAAPSVLDEDMESVLGRLYGPERARWLVPFCRSLHLLFLDPSSQLRTAVLKALHHSMKA